MNVKRAFSLVPKLLFVVFISALLIGQLLGQPILVGFVQTESMEPTMSAGDGFIAVPAPISGEVNKHDIITFEATEIQRGGLVTHRVVRETDRGYFTRGDANPFTDQDAGEPLVREVQINAKVLQVGGNVIIIPKLGSLNQGIQEAFRSIQKQISSFFGIRAFLGAQGLAYLILGITAVALSIDYLVIGSARQEDRNQVRNRDQGNSTRLIVAGLGLLVVIGATAAMVGPAGSQEISIVSAEFESEDPTVIETGESESLDYFVRNSGLIPVYSYLEPGSEGVNIEPREVTVPAQSTVNATLTLSAPPEAGYYHRYVVEHRYLAILPQSIIRTLYSTHPWLPIIATGIVIWVPFYLLGTWLVGTSRVRRRTREGPGTIHRLTARFK